LQELQENSNRSDDTINNLELIQKEKQNEIEALEALNTSLSAQLSESKNKEIESEAQINVLQHELKDMQSENGKLLCDLNISETERKELKTLNNELMNKLQTQQDNISQLESRVILKDEEIDALLNTIIERDTTVQEKITFIENIQNQFKAYRNWIDHTVIPHLRLQRKETENHHYAELNLLLTELHEAKKFINYQAQYLNALKSDVYWLNVQNKQLNEIITSMIEEQKEQHGGYYLNKSKEKISPSKQKKQQQQQQRKHKINDVIPLDDTSDSTTVSNSSRSTISHCDTKHDSRKWLLFQL
jgi:chromosome segregation ATPase